MISIVASSIHGCNSFSFFHIYLKKFVVNNLFFPELTINNKIKINQLLKVGLKSSLVN